MVNKQLVDYITAQLRAGYDIVSLRGYLIRYGYSSSDVDDAIKLAYQPELATTTHQWKRTAFLIAVLPAIALLVVAFIMLMPGRQPEQLLDVELRGVVTDVYPGQNVEFIVSLLNFGTAERYDLMLVHELIDAGGKLIARQEETAAIETRMSKTSQFAIPENAAAGRYTLRTTAGYNGKEATSTIIVAVLEKKAEAKQPEEAPEPEEAEKEPVEPVKEKPTTTISFVSQLENIKKTSETEPEKAAVMCSSLPDQDNINSCFRSLAEHTANPVLCSRINATTGQDSCYYYFAMRGDYSQCEKITAETPRQACENLKKASELMAGIK